jgi:hypothetical protein
MVNALLDAGDLITRARPKPLDQELAFDLMKGALSTDDDQRRTRGTRREDVASEAGPHVVLRVLRFLR